LKTRGRKSDRAKSGVLDKEDNLGLSETSESGIPSERSTSVNPTRNEALLNLDGIFERQAKVVKIWGSSERGEGNKLC